MDLFDDGAQSDRYVSEIYTSRRPNLRHAKVTKKSGKPLGQKVIRDKVTFDAFTGIAVTKFNSEDIRYIQISPQYNINDTLKFVPGLRGGNF